MKIRETERETEMRVDDHHYIMIGFPASPLQYDARLAGIEAKERQHSVMHLDSCFQPSFLPLRSTDEDILVLGEAAHDQG